jgi:hypothetical protein
VIYPGALRVKEVGLKDAIKQQMNITSIAKSNDPSWGTAY